MGMEYLSNNHCNGGEDSGAVNPPVILGLQPSTLIDHIAKVDWSLLSQISGESGGSFPVEIEELEHILSEVKFYILSSPDDSSPVRTIARGSVTNAIRGLAAGFGVSCGVIGACGDDEQEKLFVSNMSLYGMNISRLRMKKGSTAQCVCLVDELANHTMRPCLSNTAKIQADALIREEFTNQVWEWKEKYGGTITNQIKRLGASCDWTREHFSLDEQLSRAVIEAFVRLHEKGLIYQGSYMVNWSPNLQTTVSDLEVEYSEEPGTLYYIKYRVAGGSRSELSSTTGFG